MSSAVWSDEVQGVTLPPLEAWFASSSDVQAAQARDALKRGHFIYLEPEARARALEHLTARSVEQAGLLVGRVFFGAFDAASESRYIIQITDAIPARDDNATATSVSISPRTWLDVQPLLAEGKVTIGWFHSHPNLGAFFSGTDTKTQRALFHAPYNLGWVVDWIRDEEAWFMGPGAEPVQGEVMAAAMTHKASNPQQLAALPTESCSQTNNSSEAPASRLRHGAKFGGQCHTSPIVK